MLCSKCKIFSIHLPNYDSYICENGHVLCRTCNDRSRQKCSICGGRIVRQTEFRLEGVPTAFFKNSVNDSAIFNDEDSEIRPTFHSETMSGVEEWHCRYFRDFESEYDSEKVSGCEDLNWNVHCGNIPLGQNYYMSFCNGQVVSSRQSNTGDSARQQEGRLESNHHLRVNKSMPSLKQSKSVCKFRTPLLDENYIPGLVKQPQCDPKELYRKTISGEVDFDPKQDYYQRMAHVNEIQEFYKRPNLELARKSSSKLEFQGKAAKSDSTTLLEHLAEFRAATNYIPPAQIDVYALHSDPSRPEPTIITKSRTIVSKDNTKSRDFKEKKESKFKSHENSNEHKVKVDVGTMMDLCSDPCVNPIPYTLLGSFSTNPRSDYQLSNTSTSQGKVNSENKEIKEHKDDTKEKTENPEVKLVKEDIQNPGLQSQRSLRNMLREKLKAEVYSQFEKSPAQQRNNFMTKTRYKPSPLVALHVDSVKDVNRANITELINQEIEKALTKWTSVSDEMITPSQRREEIIRQSKNQVRERLLQEIYSNFNQRQNSARSTSETKSEPSMGTTSPRNDVLENEPLEINSQSNHGESSDQTQNKLTSESAPASCCICHLQQREVRHVALSTESYPKLNPELTVLNISKSKDLKSTSNFNFKISTESKCSCNLGPQYNISTLHAPTDAEKEIINEIQKQFENQQRFVSVQNTMSTTKTSDPVHTSVIEENREEDNNAPKSNTSPIYELPSKESGNSEDHCETNNNTMAEESQLSKLSEGPFIQSGTETPFQSSIHPPFRSSTGINTNIPPVTEITVATVYQTENVVHSVSYPEQGCDKQELMECLESDEMKEVARNLAEDYREEPKNKSQTAMDIPDFINFLKEKFPNISLKQIKEIIINLPNDYNDSSAELGVDMSLRNSTTSKNNLLPSLDTPIQKNVETTENLSTFSSLTVNAWRAYYSPPSVEEEASSEPTPQFKIISRLDLESSWLGNSVKDIRPAAELNIPRSPVICPITTCNKLIFVSEFSKHIKVDHVKIPVESISPGKCKNLFLDPKVDHHGVNKCHILYLVTDKIRDLGSREYKDFLPVLVMSTKVSLLELVCSEYRPRSREVIRSRQNFLMIWLTGLSPTDLPIYFSLTAWSRCGPIPKCHIVHSGKLYSIRNGQDARTLYRNGQVLLLSHEQCCMLTNDGRNMIELQVVVH